MSFWNKFSRLGMAAIAAGTIALAAAAHFDGTPSSQPQPETAAPKPSKRFNIN